MCCDGNRWGQTGDVQSGHRTRLLLFQVLISLPYGISLVFRILIYWILEDRIQVFFGIRIQPDLLNTDPIRIESSPRFIMTKCDTKFIIGSFLIIGANFGLHGSGSQTSKRCFPIVSDLGFFSRSVPFVDSDSGISFIQFPDIFRLVLIFFFLSTGFTMMKWPH